jgi:hypothetical protein
MKQEKSTEFRKIIKDLLDNEKCTQVFFNDQEKKGKRASMPWARVHDFLLASAYLDSGMSRLEIFWTVLERGIDMHQFV